MKKIGIVVALMIMISLFAACGEKTETIKINDGGNKTADVTKPADGNGQTKQTPDNADNPEKPNDTATSKPTEQGKPESGDPCKPVITDTSDIPETTVEPYEQSQMINAMKLIPKEAAAKTNSEAKFSIINFSNVKAVIDRLKYRPDKDIDAMMRCVPMVMQSAMYKPLNDFERFENLLWTVTDITSFTSWMAGNFSANMNLTPILTKEKYKKYPLVYGYNLYKAPETNEAPRYGRCAMPLADNFVLVSGSDITDLAKNSILNITEKGSGMLSDPKLAKLISYLGDPESCAIIRSDETYGDISKRISGTPKLPKELKEIPKEVLLMQQGVKELCGYERSSELMFVGAGFYPNDVYNLRFVLFYNDPSIVKSDMKLLREFWRKPVVQNIEKWRQIFGLTETRFSVKDNMGFIECKTSSQFSGIDVVNTVSVRIGQSMSLPFVKH